VVVLASSVFLHGRTCAKEVEIVTELANLQLRKLLVGINEWWIKALTLFVT
jgi:hypothetical protein